MGAGALPLDVLTEVDRSQEGAARQSVLVVRGALAAHVGPEAANDRADCLVVVAAPLEERPETLLEGALIEGAHTDKTINDTEVLKISAFLHELFDKSDDLLTTGNLPLTEAVRRIWELHERGITCRYHIVLCSNDQGLSASARTLLEGAIRSLPSVGYETYGAADLIRDIGGEGRQIECGLLQVVGKEAFESCR